MGKFVNIINKKFGRLTVLEKTDKRDTSGAVIWKCKCDCGKEIYVSGTSLRSGHATSCGCYSLELSAQKGKNRLINRVGQKYGKLTVIERLENTLDGKTRWRCKCECGNIYDTTGDALQSGKSKSCGCLKTSFGEYKIAALLDELKLPYEKEKIFKSCKFETGRYGRFDFYVNNSYLIEFDGKQHFLPEAGWGEDIEIVKARDEFKNKWCKNNNIPLIRISYLNENDILPSDLILETTRYRYI